MNGSIVEIFLSGITNCLVLAQGNKDQLVINKKNEWFLLYPLRMGGGHFPTCEVVLVKGAIYISVIASPIDIFCRFYSCWEIGHLVE